MSLAHQQMVNMFSNPDPHNQGIYNMLMKLYPAFAKKVFEGSGFIGKLVRMGYDSSDVLDFPICGRCESLAALDGYHWNGKQYVNKCTCMKEGCGHTTVNPITFREWIRDEIRHTAPKEVIEQLDDLLDMAVDLYAKQMMAKAERDLTEALALKNGAIRQAGSIIMPDGETHVVPAKISVNEFSMSDKDFKQTLD